MGYLPVLSPVTGPAVATKEALMFVFAASACRARATVCATAFDGLRRLRRVARRAIKKPEESFLISSVRRELATGGISDPLGGKFPMKPTHRL